MTYYDIALAEIGTAEIPNVKANPRIVDYHQATTLRAKSDEVPWCSSFVNWVLQTAGYPTTRSAAARSWVRYGKACEMQRAAIVVLSRGNNPAFGHVGFIDRFDGSYVWVLGGNQNNRVSIARYPLSRVVACRMPVAKIAPLA